MGKRATSLILLAATIQASTFGPGVAMAAEPPKVGEAQPNPRWIHIANEGNYDGYPGGGVAITRATFEQIVKNFKADPRYKLGANSLGEGRIVPFDYAHVSEMDPRYGDPAANERAAAWVMDVQIRVDDKGRSQLWGWTLLGEEVKASIEKGEITYVSIAYVPQATHPVTGESIGALMTSVAFTNKPFIRDLTPLAASSGFAAELAANMRANPEFADVVERMVRASKGANPAGDTPMTLAQQLAALFSINLAAVGAEDAIVKEASEAVKCKKEHRDLSDSLKDTGFTSLSDLIKKLPDLLKAKSDLEGLSKKFEDAVKELAGFQDKEAEVEVAAAMSFHKFPDTAKKLMLKAFKEDPAAFRKEYPIPDDKRKHLLSTFAAGAGGTQVVTPKALTISDTNTDDGANGGDKIDLRSFTGNITQQTIAYLRSKDPGFEKLPWNEQVSRAGTFRQQNQARIVFA